MSIANIFATFYEELYSRRVTEDAYEANGQVEGDSVPAFTENELLKALKSLKNGKCKDTAGIRAEMLKNIGDGTWGRYEKGTTGLIQLNTTGNHGNTKILEKVCYHSLVQKWRPSRSEELQTHMYYPSPVQTF